MYEDIYNKTNLDRIVGVIRDVQPLNVCDYGGGVGIVAIELAKRGHNVTLIDASIDALRAAEYFAIKEGVNITTQCETSLDPNIYASCFDVIVSKDLIEHIDDDLSLIKAFHSSLRDQGVLILTTQNSKSLNYLLEGGIRRLLHPTVKWMGWDRTHVRFYNAKTLDLILQKAGFHSTQFESGYIFPYKLFSLILPWLSSKSSGFLFKIDRFCMNRKSLRKLGWNIMSVSKK